MRDLWRGVGHRGGCNTGGSVGPTRTSTLHTLITTNCRPGLAEFMEKAQWRWQVGSAGVVAQAEPGLEPLPQVSCCAAAFFSETVIS